MILGVKDFIAGLVLKNYLFVSLSCPSVLVVNIENRISDVERPFVPQNRSVSLSSQFAALTLLTNSQPHTQPHTQPMSPDKLQLQSGI